MDFRNLLITHINKFFDALENEINPTSADTESHTEFDYIDDDEDYVDDYPFSDESDPDSSFESKTEENVSEWPNIGPALVLPSVGAPAWPNVGQVVGVMAKEKVVKSAPVHRADTALVANVQPAPSSDDTVYLDNRGRACVPNSISRAAGFSAGQHVYISKRANGLGVILLRVASKTGHLSTYTVDKHGNIRLSQDLLRRSGLGLETAIRFKIVPGGILALAG